MQKNSTLLYWLLATLCICCGTFFQTAKAQLQVYDTIVGTPANQATQLAQLLVGMGVQVSNAQLNCPGAGWGTFNGTNSNIGLSNGVLITSGHILNAVGPNDQQDATTNNNSGGDLTLSAVINDTTFDACVLEFDVIPQNDTLTFDYVFGSEEYLEFVGLGFNDAFGFFISGPGISGQKNMARVPGTNLPVTINNVNATTNSSFFVDNGDGSTPQANPSVQYDGFTVVLTARAGNLQPNATYHLKLVVADVEDHDLDSGVFLKGGSLGSTSTTGRPQTVSSQAVSRVYPNPSLPGETTLRIGAMKHLYSQLNIAVFDMKGQQISSQTAAKRSALVSDFELDTAKLPAGLYQYVVTSSQELIASGQFNLLK